ncbi:MAG: hypothetical protein M1374_01540 [Firmicutes bacterium]|nr:hypothetical protein [Bacillota bacterium]
MARGSFSRTVARAAASGGSKGYKAKAPRGWYAMLSAIVLGGFALIGYSRYELNYVAPATPPTASDHWYAALSFDVCGTIEPDIAANTNITTVGIRTFGNGIIDIDPGAVSKPSLFTGKHATLGNFVAHYSGLVLSSTVLGLPNPKYKAPIVTTTTTTAATTTTAVTTPTSKSQSTATTTSGSKAKSTASTTTAAAKSKSTATTTSGSKAKSTASTTTTTAAPITKPLVSNGESCNRSLGPDTGTGRVLLEVWPSPTAKKGKIYHGNPSNLALKNGQMITIGFVPKSVTSLPEPKSKATLVNDLGGLTNSGLAAQNKLKKALQASTKPTKSPVSTTKTASKAAPKPSGSKKKKS